MPITADELARWMERHERDSAELHRDFRDLLSKVDDRTDRLTTRITVIFSVVAVLWSLFLVVAPVLRGLLNLPSG